MNQPVLGAFANPAQFLIGTGPSGAVGLSGPVGAGSAFANFAANGIYPTPNLGGPFQLLQFPLGYAQRKFDDPFAEQASLEIENQIAKDWFVSTGYQFIHASKIPVYSSINGVPNGTNASGIQTFTPADPNFGFALLVAPTGFSIYHAGTLGLRKNFSQHFSALANYTYSKSIDIATDVQLTATPQDYLHPGQDRARGDNDITNRFTLALLGETPENTNILLRDFKASILTSLQSARYYTILVGFPILGDQYPFSDRVGNIGRNTYRGDPSYTTDLRIQRLFPISERLKGEFSFEAFNLLNRANVDDIDHVYGNPVLLGPQPRAYKDGISSPTNPTFGSPKFVAPARQLQFSVRLVF
jgi:hypothetical protein